MTGFAAAVLLLAVAAALGRRIQGAIGRPEGMASDPIVGLGLGLGSLSVAARLLSLLELLTPFALWSIAALAALAAGPGWRQSILDSRSALDRLLGIVRGGNPLERVALGALVILTGSALVGSLAPVAHGDALAGYALLPAQHLRAGGFADLPIRYARYPMAVPFLYLYPMSLGIESGAKALNLLLGLALLVATYRLGRALLPEISRSWLLAGVVILFGNPIVIEQAAAFHQEMGYALFATLTLCSAQNWLSGEPRGPLRTGLLVGFAAGSKYTGLYFFLVPVVVGLLQTRADLRRRFQEVGTALLVALVACSPWYLANWIEKGDPISPYTEEIVLASANEEETAIDRAHERAGIEDSFGRILISPWELTIDGRRYEVGRYGFLPLYLAALPIGLIGALDRRMALLLLVSLPYYLLIVWRAGDGWYLSPFLSVATVVAVKGAATVSKGGKPGRWAAHLLVGFCLAAGVMGGLVHATRFVGVVTNRESRDDYLSRTTWLYEAYRAANEVLPPDARVYVRGGYHYYHLDREIVPGDPETLTDAGRKFCEIDDPALFFERLRRQGVTHIVAADPEASSIQTPQHVPLHLRFHLHLEWGAGAGGALTEIDRGTATLNASALLGTGNQTEFVIYRLEPHPAEK